MDHGEDARRLNATVPVQELLEGEQADYLGGRGRYERRGEGQVGSRNGYAPGRVRTAEGAFEVAVPQVRGAASRFGRR